jgi:hypothetical protein
MKFGISTFVTDEGVALKMLRGALVGREKDETTASEDLEAALHWV